MGFWELDWFDFDDDDDDDKTVRVREHYRRPPKRSGCLLSILSFAIPVIVILVATIFYWTKT